MKNAIARTRYLTQRATRTALMTSISLIVFLFAACDKNSPPGQGDSNALTGPQAQSGRLSKAAAVPLGTASTFAVLGATTVTNTGASLITGDLGVYASPASGFAITGFDLTPGVNTIVYGPLGTVTDGPGKVTGTIYAGGDVGSIVQKAQADAHTAYNNLVAQPINFSMGTVQELKNLVLIPGVYLFPSSADLDGTLILQGNSNAVFIFIIGSTLTTVTGSQVILQGGAQAGNVYWAVGSSATLGTGTQFVGNIIAVTSITITTGVSMSGSALALGGAVTLDTDNISVSAGSGGGTNPPPPPPKPCRDFVTGGGWIDGGSDAKSHKNDKATFGVSGGIKNGKFWGQLSFNDHGKNGVKVKSTSVTAYIYLDPVTRQIEGIAKVNGKGSFAYKVIVADNGERGRNDFFSLELPNYSAWGYSASGTLKGGNIQLHTKCEQMREKDRDNDKEDYDDKDERDGHNNCDSDRD